MTSPSQPGPDQARMKRMVIVFVAIVVVILLGLFIARLSAPATGEPEKVEAALRGTASTLLAGTGEPAALAAATCEVEGDDGTEYRCVAKGAPQEQGVHFVLADDGTISKELAGDVDLAAERSGDAVADALAADEQARGLGNPEYGCATSIRMSPDGTAEAGNAVGYLCVAKSGATSAGAGSTAAGDASIAGARYVETTPDGLLTRDYVIRTK